MLRGPLTNGIFYHPGKKVAITHVSIHTFFGMLLHFPACQPSLCARSLPLSVTGSALCQKYVTPVTLQEILQWLFMDWEESFGSVLKLSNRELLKVINASNRSVGSVIFLLSLLFLICHCHISWWMKVYLLIFSVRIRYGGIAYFFSTYWLDICQDHQQRTEDPFNESMHSFILVL